MTVCRWYSAVYSHQRGCAAGWFSWTGMDTGVSWLSTSMDGWECDSNMADRAKEKRKCDLYTTDQETYTDKCVCPLTFEPLELRLAPVLTQRREELVHLLEGQWVVQCLQWIDGGHQGATFKPCSRFQITNSFSRSHHYGYPFELLYTRHITSIKPTSCDLQALYDHKNSTQHHLVIGYPELFLEDNFQNPKNGTTAPWWIWKCFIPRWLVTQNLHN